ncbi:MAG: Holliday junction branch migration protein RuvA [Frankia sp.]
MIASVAGTVTALTPQSAVIVVGGVGLLVQCTPSTLAALRLGQEATLATALVVRENELTLYGFADADDRDVFEALQSASGVGPRLAQAVLGVHRPEVVRRAVAEEDLPTLTKVPGIGRKGAQRIVLDLKDRLGPPAGAALGADGPVVPPARSGPTGPLDQVRSALLGLGYTTTEVEAAIAALAAQLGGSGSAVEAGDPEPDVAVLLRQALAVLRPR